MHDPFLVLGFRATVRAPSFSSVLHGATWCCGVPWYAQEAEEDKVTLRPARDVNVNSGVSPSLACHVMDNHIFTNYTSGDIVK